MGVQTGATYKCKLKEWEPRAVIKLQLSKVFLYLYSLPELSHNRKTICETVRQNTRK